MAKRKPKPLTKQKQEQKPKFDLGPAHRRKRVDAEYGREIVITQVPLGPNTIATRPQAQVRCECWLDRYHQGTATRPPLLDEEQYDAGMELRRAWLYKLYGQKYGSGDSTQGCFIDGGDQGQNYKRERHEYAERIVRDFHSRDNGLSKEQRLVILAVCQENMSAGDTYRKQTLRRGLTLMAHYWRKGRPVADADAGVETERMKKYFHIRQKSG